VSQLEINPQEFHHGQLNNSFSRQPYSGFGRCHHSCVSLHLESHSSNSGIRNPDHSYVSLQLAVSVDEGLIKESSADMWSAYLATA
jgi:hypothetical protein